jgi:hypothetical protein
MLRRKKGVGKSAAVGSKWREINGFSVACAGADANLGWVRAAHGADE